MKELMVGTRVMVTKDKQRLPEKRHNLAGREGTIVTVMTGKYEGTFVVEVEGISGGTDLVPLHDTMLITGSPLEVKYDFPRNSYTVSGIDHPSGIIIDPDNPKQGCYVFFEGKVKPAKFIRARSTPDLFGRELTFSVYIADGNENQ